MVKMLATKDRAEIVLPVLPWDVVTRKKGRETYQRYSATEMVFRPIRSRLRYVFYKRDGQGQKEKDDKNHDIILSVTKSFVKGSGYVPQKEVFGIVCDDTGKQATYALLSIDSWSAYISYDRAAKEFEKIVPPEGFIVAYKIGTRGVNDGDTVVPKTKSYNGGESVDIEALDLDRPIHIKITDEFDAIWEASESWANCKKWNAEKVEIKDVSTLPVLPEFSEEFPFGTPEDDEH
jgi:hypothetical protein